MGFCSCTPQSFYFTGLKPFTDRFLSVTTWTKLMYNSLIDKVVWKRDLPTFSNPPNFPNTPFKKSHRRWRCPQYIPPPNLVVLIFSKQKCQPPPPVGRRFFFFSKPSRWIKGIPHCQLAKLTSLERHTHVCIHVYIIHITCVYSQHEYVYSVYIYIYMIYTYIFGWWFVLNTNTFSLGWVDSSLKYPLVEPRDTLSKSRFLHQPWIL